MMLILFAVVLPAFAQDALEKTTLQKVREMLLEIVPDSAGLSNLNNKIDSVLALLDASVIDSNALTDLNLRIDTLKNESASISSTLNNKQNTLVSGSNIKTINGATLLGSGNIIISGGGGGGAVNSVNGFTGDVTLGITDIPDLETTLNGKQGAYANLTSLGQLSNNAGLLLNNGSGIFSYSPTTTIGLSLLSLSTPGTNSYLRFTGGDTIPVYRTTSQVRSDLSIDNVDNTSDLNKPISTAVQSALNDKLRLDFNNYNFVEDPSGDVVIPIIISGGFISSTELGNLPVSTATQTALSLKANLASPTFTGTVTLPATTSIGNVSSTELGYVDGVTSAIQTQLNSKQAAITGGATTITSDNLTSNRTLVSDGNGKIGVSTTTSTEIGYVSGVTSSIQNQLNSKTNAADVNALIEANEDTTGQATIAAITTLDSLARAFWAGELTGGGAGVNIEAVDENTISFASGEVILLKQNELKVDGNAEISIDPLVLNRISALEDTIYSLRNAINTLIASIETKLDKSLLAGGTTDQVLAKIDGDDYNFTWATIEAGEPVFPPDETPPSPPTGLNATATDESSITLNWTDPADGDLDSIRIYEYKNATEDSTAMTWIASVGAGVETYNRTGLDAETTYWYRLKAMDDSSNVSYFSNADSSTTFEYEGGVEPLYVIDFENGGIRPQMTGVDPDSSSMLVNSTGAYSSNYGLRVNGAGSVVYAYYELPSAMDSIYVKFWVRIPDVSWTGSGQAAVGWFNTSGERTMVGVSISAEDDNKATTWLASTDGGDKDVSASTTTRGSWHELKMYYRTNGVNQSWHGFWIDGVPFSEWGGGTGITTDVTTNQVTEVCIGHYFVGISGGYVDFDNIRIYDKDPDE